MAKIWSNRQDVEIAVDCITQIVLTSKTLPPELLEAYKKILSRASHGQVSYFYELLQSACPEAVQMFGQVKL